MDKDTRDEGKRDRMLKKCVTFAGDQVAIPAPADGTANHVVEATASTFAAPIDSQIPELPDDMLERLQHNFSPDDSADIDAIDVRTFFD